jgi:ABC-type polysaccharide/polyol phosphate transport system ATPase subunit
MSEPIIKVELKDVSKRHNIYERPVDRLKEIISRNRRCYHREYWALRNINVKFEQCTTAVLGPNGAGKSTMLQLIAGVLQPTSGNLIVRGRVTAILELGAGFQPEFTGRENVLLNGMMLGIAQSEMEERMASIAEFAEVGDFFDQPLKTYSSGMAIRLAFSTAISVDPDVLLVDEALAVGDERFIKKCHFKIKELQYAGKTIIFVTHNARLVNDYCQKAVLLSGGKIVDVGSVDQIMPQYYKIMEDPALYGEKKFTKPRPRLA